MARRKRSDRNRSLGRVTYITLPAVNMIDEIKETYQIPKHKACDEFAYLASVGLEVRHSNMEALFAPFRKRSKRKR